MARSRPSVLVVDDDAATRQGVTVLLESWGYQPSEAADGAARQHGGLSGVPSEAPNSIQGHAEIVELTAEEAKSVSKYWLVGDTLFDRHELAH